MRNPQKSAKKATPKGGKTAAPVPFGNPMDEEKDLLSWRSPDRLHKPRGREFYSTAGAFVILLSIIALFFKEILLMLTIWAFAFINYVMGKVPPSETVHAITTRGVKTGQRKFFWGELIRFWFEDKWGKTILYIDTLRAFPRRVMLVVGSIPKEKIKEVLLRHIPYDKPELTSVEKATRWLEEKIPLEETSLKASTARAAK